jgi:biopolymer transport protein ExbD
MASIAKYKAELRKQKRRKAVPHEVNFLNITAMMDMMTIILVFLLKSLSSSSANLPSANDLTLPTSVLEGEPAQEGIQVVVSRDKILVNGNELKGVEVPGCFTNAADAPKPQEPYRLVFCPGDSPHGFAPKFKAKGSANDLEIAPLLNAVETPVRVAEEIAKSKATPGKPPIVEAMILFDRYTSYRVMSEVMFTLGLAKIGKFHFVAMQKGGS